MICMMREVLEVHYWRSYMGEKGYYSKPIETLKLLSKEMNILDRNRKKAVDDFYDEKNGIEEEFELSETASSEVREKKVVEADAGYQSWNDKINQYRSGTEKLHSRESFALAKAVDESGNTVSPEVAVRRLQDQSSQRKKRHRKDDNAGILNLTNNAEAGYARIQELSSDIIKEADKQREKELRVADKKFNNEHAAHTARRDLKLKQSNRKYIIRTERENDDFAERVEQTIFPDKVREQYEEMQYQRPNYEVFEPAETFPQGIQFGYAAYDVTEHLTDRLKGTVLNRRFEYAEVEANGRTYLTMPFGYGFDENYFSTMFEFDDSNREQAQELIRNLALNLYMSIPVNKCWCTFIDPVSLGDTFALFSPLGERDENGRGDERAIDTRIWSLDEDIEDRLKLIIDHTTDVIQRCLQNQFNNILEYNEDAGINAEPLRFVVIMDFPRRFTDRALDYLESILDNGAKTGVYTLIAGDTKEMDKWPDSSTVGRIRNRIRNTVSTDGRFLYLQEKTIEGNLRFFPLAGPSFCRSLKGSGKISEGR